MLRKNAIAAAMPVIRNLHKLNVSLEAIEESPLGDLVAESMPTDIVAEVIEGQEVPTAEIAANAVETAATITPIHSLVNDNTCAAGAEFVKTAISTARNLVIPTIGKLADAVASRLSMSAVPPQTISEVGVSGLAVYKPLIDQVENAAFGGGGVDMPKPVTAMPVLAAADLMQYLSVADTQLTERITAVLSGHPDSYLSNVATNIIRGSTVDIVGEFAPVYRVNEVGSLSPSLTLYSLDPLLLAWIMLGNLKDNPPGNVEVSLGDWQEACLAARMSISYAIMAILGRVVNLIAKDWLLVPRGLIAPPDVDLWRTNTHTIYVLDRQYEKYLDANGTADAVLAAAVAKKSEGELDVPNLLRNNETLTAAWGEYCATYARNARIEASDTMSTAICRAVREHLSDNPPSIETSSRDRLQIGEAVDAYVKDRVLNSDTLYPTIAHVVGCIMYDKTDAHHIVYHLDRVCKEQPDLSPRTAAYLAVVEMVADWTLCQMKIVTQ